MKTVLGIAGSLRRGSFNRLLIRAAVDMIVGDLSIRTYEGLETIPLFNEDLEATEPEGVMHLRREVAQADGVLIATPEYNWSIPGVLKNAIDWLSRPPADVLAGKPVAVIGASSGRWGTRLSQAALRQVLTATESLVLPRPAMFVQEAAGAFDEAGRLIDASVGEQLERVLSAFAVWIDDVRH